MYNNFKGSDKTMNIMTKRGNLDNVVTFEHICDVIADMNNIPQNQISLGSICIVLKGQNNTLEVYMADSQKQWQPLLTNGSGGGSGGGVSLYICSASEIDDQTGEPDIATPSSSTIYVVPNDNGATQYMYVDNDWQIIGGGEGSGSSSSDEHFPPTGNFISNFTNTVSSNVSYTDATGYNNIIATGAQYAHVEGYESTVSGDGPHAEGWQTEAAGKGAHAEGISTIASGNGAHVEGMNNLASANCSHAEGYGTTALYTYTHTEGFYTVASTGNGAHAEGNRTQATAVGAHSEGSETKASGLAAHSEGSYTTANHKCQHVFGEYNIVDDSVSSAGYRGNYIEIVGNGAINNRSNARTLDWSGNEWLAGSITLGNTTLTEAQLQNLLALLN